MGDKVEDECNVGDRETADCSPEDHSVDFVGEEIEEEVAVDRNHEDSHEPRDHLQYQSFLRNGEINLRL